MQCYKTYMTAHDSFTLHLIKEDLMSPCKPYLEDQWLTCKKETI